MLKVLLICAALAWAGEAAAAEAIAYGPAAAWVKPLPIPASAVGAEGAAAQVLLQDEQDWFGPDGDERYSDAAFRILTPQGLAGAGTIIIPWNPEVDAVTVHHIHIIRGTQVIDALSGGKTLTVLRRETNLEMSMLDGTLTGTLQLEGLQVGDIIDMAVTRRRRDPVMQGRTESFALLSPAGVVGRFHFSGRWPASKAIRWRVGDGLGEPLVTHKGDETEMVIDLANVRAPKPPEGAPSRFAIVGLLQISQFADWNEVSALMAPLYRKAASLGPTSPIKAEIARIRASSADPIARAAAALRLVQEQTRYLFLGMDFGGYTPADADVTWSRRFGDCKGKTALLLALLDGLGVEAEPALVSASNGDGMDDRLPAVSEFDHVLVRAVIAGRVYWLDGTRSGDHDITTIPPPSFRWALPLRAPGAGLEPILQPPLERPTMEAVTRIDASKGVEAPAPAHVERLFRSDTAIGVHILYSNMDKAEADRSMRTYWAGLYPWITPDKVGFDWDEVHGEGRMWMDGLARMNWSHKDSVQDFDIRESELGWNASFVRQPGPRNDAPFAVNHPAYSTWTVVIILPDRGRGFTLLSAEDVDSQIAAYVYRRKSRLENGVVTMVSSERSLASEFPASEAQANAKALRDLSSYDVVIRTDDAPPSAPAPAIEPPLSTPIDAAGFSRRGVSYMVHKDWTHAIADFTEAARLEPKVGRHFYNRGVAYHGGGQDALALADIDRALALKADDAYALTARAELRLAKGDDAAALKDFEASARAAPSEARLFQRRADALDRAGHFEQAIAAYDEVIRRFPQSDRMDRYLASRCWTAVKWGHGLERALEDCNAALALKPETPGLLQSRGFVQLRLGHPDLAVADYDAVLRLAPDAGPSLYGRGVARLRQGEGSEGNADLAAAAKLDPKLAAEFAGYGVKP